MAPVKKATVKPEAKAVAPAVKPSAPKEEEKATAKAVVKTEEKKTETPAAAVKAVLAPEKKAAEKKSAAKKPATKRSAAKKADLKASVCIQFSGKSYSEEELVKMAKDVWKFDLKQKLSDLVNVELYVKPEENTVYYVMNKDYAGSFYI